MTTMPPWVRGMRAAAVFLTRVPLGGFPYAPADWRWCSAYFPLIGAVLGVMLANVWYLAAPLGAPAAAVIVLVVSVLLTGGFHEDGLADTVDALGGGYDKPRVLEILKDSRIGAFGALALCLSLGLRVCLLVALGDRAPIALVVTQCASRLPPVWMMVTMPYVTGSASRSRDVIGAQVPQALVASFTAVALALWLLPPVQAAGAAVVAGLAALVLGWRFMRRVGGITGDFLGATQQVVECVLLCALVL